MLSLRGEDFCLAAADLTCKIDALFRRLVRFGYLRNNLTVSDLLLSGKADTDIFRNMFKSHHCLNHLLPPISSSDN